MTQKEINKASEDFSEREYKIGDIDKNPLYKGFYHGAIWRVNSVWHESSETPNKEKELLILDHNNRPWVIRPGHIWENTVEIFCVKKWAYIKDLLPIKED